MKTRPILFSGPMVRAILEGRKTQTRRVMKFQIPEDSAPFRGGLFNPIVVDRHGNEEPGPEVFGAYDDDGEWGTKCPYGQPGDRLWVRETFSGPWCMGDTQPSKWGRSSRIWYWADGNPEEGDWTRPRPSIHMPRWASRITLEIVSVRVERLQGISEADAVAEGCDEEFGHTADCNDDFCALNGDMNSCVGNLTTARENYRALWESINGPGSWERNDWVWVIGFKRIEKGESK